MPVLGVVRVDLRCRVELPDDVVAASLATWTVRLDVQDVTEADGPAVPEATAVFPVRSAEGGLLGPYDLQVDLARGRDHALSVHVRPAARADVRTGDLLSVARHPVAAAGGGQSIVVGVRRV